MEVCEERNTRAHQNLSPPSPLRGRGAGGEGAALRTDAIRRAIPHRPSPLRVLCVSAVILLPLLTGCDYPFPGKPNPANRPVPENQIVAFDQLFSRNCTGCHGAEGKLGPAPPLNDPLFLAIVPDETLLQVLQHGRPGTPMPAFAFENGGTLTVEQVRVLAEGLKKNWLPKEPPAATPPPYLLANADSDTINTLPGDAERGAEIFSRACADCHGEDGKSDDSTINDPAFLALISDQALRRIIITGRPDLGMPSYRETDGRANDFKPLTSAEINDLVALLASWRSKEGVANSPSPPPQGRGETSN